MSTYDATELLRPGATPVAVVDLDSTVCDSSPRHHLVPTERKNENVSWHGYSRACPMDLPIVGMIELVKLLRRSCFVFFLSGRMDVALPETLGWLRGWDVPFDRIRLRADSELGSVPEYKINVLKGWQAEGWQLKLVIDDYPDLCAEVTQATGIPTVTPMLPLHYATEMPGL